MFVYSGKCRMGNCGEVTPLIDNFDNPLFVGDIVIISTINETGICENYGLTVVVSDRYQTFNNNTYFVEREGNVEYFVMGIKDVNFMSVDTKWIVKKLKSFEDVIDKEHWKDYGFNYKKD